MDNQRALDENDQLAAANLRVLWDKARAERQLTQSHAAAALGWSNATISNYLRGKRALGVVAVNRWAAYLHCSVFNIRPDYYALLDVEGGRIPELDIDVELMDTILEHVFIALEERDRPLPYERIARLVKALYMQARREKNRVDPDTIRTIVQVTE